MRLPFNRHMEEKEKITQESLAELAELAESEGLTSEDIERMLRAKQHIDSRLPRYIAVGGRTYKVKQVSQKVRTKIDNLALEAYFLQQQAKEQITLRKAKRINSRLRATHAKIAAYYLLGNLALWVPFLWAVKWRALLWRNSETVFRINDAGASDPDTSFYLANWDIIKAILALSTRPVGEGIKQFAERKESAENMLEKDALPKKAEDGKSTGSSRPRRTTRK